MIEAGHIGHYGLLIWPQCTHDVYASPRRQREVDEERQRERERERGRMRPKLPKAAWLLFPAGCENNRRRVGRSGLPLWFHSFKFLQFPSPAPPLGVGVSQRARRVGEVLSKKAEGHWSRKFRLGHKHTLTPQ